MSLFTLGLNHQTAPLDVRERVVFTPSAWRDALRDLSRRGRVRKRRSCRRATAPRSTCAAERAAGAVARWLAEYHRFEPARARTPYLYTLPREQAVTHAFRVASGLDSMVLGEPQILGQMKQAVRSAESAGTLGLVLNKLFQRTFAVAKDVRTQTDIGARIDLDGRRRGEARRAHLSVDRGPERAASSAPAR